MSRVLNNSKRRTTGIESNQCPWELLLELSNSILGYPFDLLYSSANASWQASALVDNCFFLAQSKFPFLAREKLAVQLIDFKFGFNSCDVYERFVRQLFSDRKLNVNYVQTFLSDLGFLQFRVPEPKETQIEETKLKEYPKITENETIVDESKIKREIPASVECVRVSDGAFFEDDDYCFIQEYEIDCDPFSEVSNPYDAASDASCASMSHQTSSSNSQSNEVSSSTAIYDQSQSSDASSTVQSEALKLPCDRSQSKESNFVASRIQSDDLSNISEASIESMPSIKQEALDIDGKECVPESNKRISSTSDLKAECDKTQNNEIRGIKDKLKSKAISVESFEQDVQYKDLQYGKYAKKSNRPEKERSLDRTDDKIKKCDEKGNETMKKSGETKENNDKKKLSFKILNNCRDPRLKKRRKLEGFDT